MAGLVIVLFWLSARVFGSKDAEFFSSDFAIVGRLRSINLLSHPNHVLHTRSKLFPSANLLFYVFQSQARDKISIREPTAGYSSGTNECCGG